MESARSTKIKLKGKDILLLLLYFPPEGMVGATRLMKAMFLFEQEIKKNFQADIESFPEFMAWRFGPWSEQIPDDIEFFKGIGFISSKSFAQNGEPSMAEREEFDRWEKELLDAPVSDSQESETQDFYEPKEFFLTNTGKQFVKDKLCSRLSENQAKILIEFKNKIVSLSLFSILSYVYRKYSKGKTDWTRKSEIKTAITRN